MTPVDRKDSSILEELAAGSERGAARPVETIQLLVIRLGTQRCCVRISEVETIAALPRVAVVPGAPEHVLGVVNLRGAIVPVLDLALLLGIGRAAEEAAPLLMVVSVAGAHLGCLIDELEDIRQIPASTIQPPLATLPAAAEPYIDGGVEIAGRLLPLLRVSALDRGSDD